MVSWTLLAIGCTVGCADDTGSEDDGPCVYEERSLLASDQTPWGAQVGEDIAALYGPFPGTWTWSSSTEEIEIENAGQIIEAEAVFEVNEASYRMREHVGGGVGVACYGQTVQADGMLTFRAENEVIVSVPVTVQRSVDEPFYYVFDLINPVSAFSSQLTELSGIEGTSIRVLANWGVEGESLRATFEYVGQALDDSGGFGFMVAVAGFE